MAAFTAGRRVAVTAVAIGLAALAPAGMASANNTCGGSATCSGPAESPLPPQYTRFHLHVVRLAGADRDQTAIAVAKYFFPDGPTASQAIILADGQTAHLIDSVTVAPFARLLHAPVLLTADAVNLGASTTAYLHALAGTVTTVYLVGADLQISRQQLAQALGNVQVVVLAGADRYGTAAAVDTAFLQAWEQAAPALEAEKVGMPDLMLVPAGDLVTDFAAAWLSNDPLLLISPDSVALPASEQRFADAYAAESNTLAAAYPYFLPPAARTVALPAFAQALSGRSLASSALLAAAGSSPPLLVQPLTADGGAQLFGALSSPTISRTIDYLVMNRDPDHLVDALPLASDDTYLGNALENVAAGTFSLASNQSAIPGAPPGDPAFVPWQQPIYVDNAAIPSVSQQILATDAQAQRQYCQPSNGCLAGDTTVFVAGGAASIPNATVQQIADMVVPSS